MKTIIDLMRVDLLALRGKKGSTFRAMIILFIMCAVIGILFMPVFLAVYVFASAILITPMIINQEIRSEYGKTFCILPADRKSVVFARFLLATLFLSAISIVLYIFMQIFLMSGLSEQTMEEMIEIFDMLGISASISKFHNIIFSTAFMIGIMVMSKRLRKYYKNGAISKKNSILRSVLKGILIYIIFMIAGTVLIYASSVPFIQTVFILIFTILSALSQPADGVLLCLTFLAVGFGMAVYQAVCAMLEYDEREL